MKTKPERVLVIRVNPKIYAMVHALGVADALENGGRVNLSATISTLIEQEHEKAERPDHAR